MYVDKAGKAVQPPRTIDDSPERMEWLRDAIMVRLAKAGVRQSSIAVVVGLTQCSVSKRLRSIPPHVRERYAKTALLGLG